MDFVWKANFNFLMIIHSAFLLQVQHRNIISLIEVFEDEEKLYLVMERYGRFSLENVVFHFYFRKIENWVFVSFAIKGARRRTF